MKQHHSACDCISAVSMAQDASLSVAATATTGQRSQDHSSARIPWNINLPRVLRWQGTAALAMTAVLGIGAAQADLLQIETLDPTVLANSVMDQSSENIVINSVTVVGEAGQIATFTNGLSVPGFVDFDAGIILSSGSVSAVVGPNSSDGEGTDVTSTVPDGDADFDSLTDAPQGTFDAAYIVIDFTPSGDTVSGNFVFSSEEYNEYAPPDGASSANNTYYDVMAFFVNGVNYSITADGNDVSINTVNKTLNAADFRDNDYSDFQPDPTPFDIEPDGFTRTLTWVAPVIPGQSNILKFGVADGGDSTYDSWLLVSRDSFRVLEEPEDVDLAVTLSDNQNEIAAGQSLTLNAVVENLGVETAGRDFSVVYTLPDGVTVNSGQAASMHEYGPNASEWTCMSTAAVPQVVNCITVTSLHNTPGNSSSSISIVTDPVDIALLGNTLNTGVNLTTSDNDVDLSNNNDSDTALVVASDVTGPTISIRGMPAFTGSLDPIPVTISYNEAASILLLASIDVVNGAASNLTIVDPLNATVDITPNGAGDISLSLIAAAVQDQAGNASLATVAVTTVYSVSSPTLSFTGVPSVSIGSAPFTVQLHFSEAVTGLTVNDIQISNAILDSLNAVDSDSWELNITPDGTNDIQISIPAGAAQSVATTADSSPANLSIVYNEGAPAASLSGGPVGGIATAAYTLTINWSEPVTGFELTDFNVLNGIASNLQTTANDDEYTIDVTASGQGDVSVVITEASVTDAGGIPNPASLTHTILFDTQAPVLLIDAPIASDNIVNLSESASVVISGSTEAGASVSASLQDSLGTTLDLTVSVDSSGNWVSEAADFSSLQDGAISLVASATDVVGNESVLSSISLQLQRQTPTIIANMVTGDNTINAQEGTSDVLLGGVSTGLADGDAVIVVINSVFYAAAVSSDTWQVLIPQLDVAAWTDGEVVSLDASSSVGNNATQVSYSLGIDAIAPSVSLDALSLAVGNNQLTYAVSGSCTFGDWDVAVTIDSVVPATQFIVCDSNSTFSTVFDVSGLPDGLDVVIVSASQVDNAGNSSGLNQLSTHKDLLSPVLSIATVAVDDRINLLEAQATVLVSGAVVDIQDGQTVTVDVNGTQYTALVNAGLWSINLPFADIEGMGSNETLLANASTLAGLPASQVSRDIQINLSEPAMPTVQSLSTTLATPLITGSADFLSGDEFEVIVNGISYLLSSTQIIDTGDGGWSLSIPGGDALVDGSYTIELIHTDSFGNQSTTTATDTLFIDGTAPDTPLVAPDLAASSDSGSSSSDDITAITQPEFTLAAGSATAGDTAVLFGNEVQVASTVVAGDGSIVFALTADLAVGSHLLNYHLIDTSGNTSGLSPQVGIEVDSAVALISLNVPVMGDNRIAASEANGLVVNGLAEAGATVLLTILDSVGSGVTSTVITNGGGVWLSDAIDVSALIEGTLQLSVLATDIAGNTDSLAPMSIALDITLPFSPMVDQLLSNNGNPTLSGLATLQSGETLVITVNGMQYTVGDGQLSIDEAGVWTVIIPESNTLNEGTFTVLAEVVDEAGNRTADSSNNELSIDTTAPLVSIVEPQAVDANNVNNYPVSGTCSIGDLAVHVDIVGASPSTQTINCQSDGLWFSVFDVSGIADGVAAIVTTASQSDSAGNTSIALPLSADKDATIPTVSINIIAGDDVLNAQEFTQDLLLSGSASFIADGQLVTILVNGLSYDAAVASGSWNLSIPQSDVAAFDSNELITANVEKSNGVSADEVQRGIALMMTLPPVPSVTNLISSNGIPVLNGTAVLSETDVLQVTLNGQQYTDGDGHLVHDGQSSWTLTLPEVDSLADNSYDVAVSVTDVAGNVSNIPGTAALLIDSVAPQVPTVNVLLSNNSTPVLGGLAVLSPSESLNITLNGVVYSQGVDISISVNDLWSLSVPEANALVDGSYDVLVSVTDAAGNVATDATLNELQIDRTPPLVSIDVISIDDLLNALELQSEVFISGSSSSEDGSVVQLLAGGFASSAMVSNQLWQITMPVADVQLLSGVVTVSAIATDLAGNVSPSVERSVEVDGVAPVVTIDPLPVVNTQNATAYVVSGSCDSTSQNVVVSVADALPGTQSVACVDGQYSATFDVSPVADGASSLSMTISQADAAGNTANSGPVLTEKDTVAPTASIVSASDGGDGVLNAVESIALSVSGSSVGAAQGDQVVVSIVSAVTTVYATALVNVDGSWSTSGIDVSSLPDSVLSLQASISDAAGNASDSLPLELVKNTESSEFAAGVISPVWESTPVFSGSSDMADNALIELHEAEGLLLCIATVVDGSWQCSANNALSDGNYMITATAVDEIGNTADISFNLSINSLLDSDNDGLPDAVEGLDDADGDGISNNLDSDSDGDGISDALEGSVDTDGDGQANYVDSDSDADGISDLMEGDIDSDEDGAPDYLDLDSDGDGISDAQEAGALPASPVDTDGDSIPDYLDQDSDADGIQDSVEGSIDSDADGVPDSQDSDSNGDGIPDVLAGTEDTDGDGIADYLDGDIDGDGIANGSEGIIDTDGDGLANYLDTDADGDTVPDAIEQAVDTDGDGRPNFLDTDSDGDSLPDALEVGDQVSSPLDSDEDSIPDYLDTDSDADGIADSIEGAVDNDEDAVPNYLDSDSDNDGLLDALEGSGDADGDGQADFLDMDSDNDGLGDALEGDLDTDADGVADYLDLDSDGDSIGDQIEGAGDFDEDGIPNNLDLDADGDSILDEVEVQWSIDPDDPDQTLAVADSDNDGSPDYLDTDSDGDTLADSVEVGDDTQTPIDSDGDGVPDYLDTDSDNDSLPDSEEGVADADGDGLPNALDNDANNDGIPDAIAGAEDIDGDGTPNYLDADIDGDGIANALEGSDDADGDGIPNYADTDSDDDGIDDAVEGSLDVDGDELPNYLDVDSDGDGIPDAIETDADPEEDGIANYLDSDSDGDGINDAQETAIDSDNDSVPNYLDTDSDNDGLSDSMEGSVDSDVDGTPDYIDTDSDNDNISDADESGSDPTTSLDSDGDDIPDYLDADSDNDGIADSVESSDDADGDGIANYLDGDSDGDGINDSHELANDSDGDGIDDFLDLDVDGDGIPDSVEGEMDSDGDGVADFQDSDADGDGIPDSVESTVDSDGDGTADYLDIDSDGDGINDSVEVGDTPDQPVDTDNDGIPDYIDTDSDDDGLLDSEEESQDSDGDGVPDQQDQDSNNDGIPDMLVGDSDTDLDGIPDRLDADIDGDGVANTVEGAVDTDGDGIYDFMDVDSDGDSIPDAVEGSNDIDGDGIPNFQDLDSDGDGIADAFEAASDTDGDGLPDFIDTDSDADGIPDELEGVVDTDEDGIPNYLDLSSDGDGIPDAMEGGADTDGDGVINSVDLDADGDGINDDVEAGGDLSFPVDSDGDGIPDFLDEDSDNDGNRDGSTGGSGGSDGNGSGDAETQDSDGDGIPDAQDEDANNDGIPDADIPNPNADTDGDGIIDQLDGDIDGDGIDNMAEGQVDTDGDGVPNFLDEDSDGDGIEDSLEGIADADGDGIVDYLDSDSDNDGVDDQFEGSGDLDGDGIPNNQDSDADGDGIGDSIEGDADADEDGLPNYLDMDSDGDGIADQIEGVLDMDGDGQANYLDHDSDGDGISDELEGGTDTDVDGTRNFMDYDSDADGIDDAIETAIDTDQDGVPDFLDSDSDNDGIRDFDEGNIDSDGDGIADYIDTDADGDGISDLIEGQIDFDVDGVPDYLDLDSDNDSIADHIEMNVDTDNDGIPDYLDRDSDGDSTPDATEGLRDADENGVPDYLEVGGPADSDNDGLLDSQEGADDADGDGLANSMDEDSDGDGIDDAVEGNRDSDNDGLPDFLDVDADGDNIPDLQEGTGDSDGDSVPDYLDLDSDDDGISDAIETTADADNDGLNNALDLDSDGDRLPDQIEGAVDSDGDGVHDAIDLDSDNDGLTDEFENFRHRLVTNRNGVLDDPATGLLVSAYDHDRDGVPDYLDLDSDNDSITDTIEANGIDADQNGRVDEFVDLNRNGLHDPLEQAALPAPDTDGDGFRDFRDLDADQDGISDLVEVSGIDANFDGRVDHLQDVNGDGIDDAVLLIPATLSDSDSDTIYDFREIDSDNDQIADILEAGGVDVDGDGRVDAVSDADGDGIPDSVDVDVTQGSDADNDGIDDTADIDFVSGNDSDADGIIDEFDPDSDGDGLADRNALALGAAVPDSDNDSVPDYQQPIKNGKVKTAVSGNGVGCSVTSILGAESRTVGHDPLFWLMLLASAITLFARRRRSCCSAAHGSLVLARHRDQAKLRGFIAERVQQPFCRTSLSTERCETSVTAVQPKHSVLAVLVVTVLLGACSHIPGLGSKPGTGNSSVQDTAKSRALAMRQRERELYRDNPPQQRLYVGAGVGVSMLEPDTDETELTLDSGAGVATNLHVGMDLRPRLSAEFIVGSLGKATLKPENNTVVPESDISVSYNAFSASALFYNGINRAAISKRQGLMGFLRAGLGVLSTSASGTETEQLNSVQLMLGFGAEYGWRNGLALRGELLSYDADARAVQLALLYRFRPRKSQTTLGSAVAEHNQTNQRRQQLRQQEKIKSNSNQPLAAGKRAAQASLGKRDPDKANVGESAAAEINRQPSAGLDTKNSTDVRAKTNADFFRTASRSVSFARGTANLTFKAETELDHIARVLVEQPGVSITIATHTDNQLSPDAARKLTKSQVVTIARYLLGKGVSTSQLIARAYGSSQPLVANSSADAQKRNRRVKITPTGRPKR